MGILSKKSLMFIAVLAMSIGAKAAATPKEWTFLLFLNGHNNLSSYGDMNIKDMEKSGSTDQVNYVVEWGSTDNTNNRRMLIQKSTDPSQVTSPVVMNVPNVDMGDVKNLVDFVKWGVDNYPAKHYFVAVWNHGSGWHFQNMSGGTLHPTDISYDDNSGNHITTEQLGAAMGEIKQYIGHNVDVYGSDACLMQMIEVATEMKGSVDYFAGSQETEPGEGWPYAPFFQKWGAAPQSTPAQVAVLLSKEYLKAYNGGVYGTKAVTFGALDLSKLDAVIASSAKLAKHLTSLGAADIKKIKTALSKVQAFYYSDYKDYGDFLKVTNSLSIAKDAQIFAQAGADLKALVLSSDNSSSYSKSTGLSIWIPSYDASSYMDRYKGLEYDKEAGWSAFVQKLQ
ncbi:MAG: clostripain-related cysteine peptidase [Pseudobdellovibrio sp.]